ncbi:MAG: 16S rRNA (uracil(1498)-N(3))-methyltransferase [Myxococcales bacterium]|nr:16S rRNA (uracil(1498)-N(3))-methyltransferase [Myxococcales bacterium]
MNLVVLEAGDFVARIGSGGTGDEAGGGDGGGTPGRRGRWRVVLRGRRFEHLRTVHRAESGRELCVGELGGAVGRGVVAAIDAESATLEVELDHAPPPKLAVVLLLALPRPKTLRRVLQTVATMGVARVVLMNSWRVDKSYWKSPQLEPEAIAEQFRLGLEQGGDTIAPEVTIERLLVPFARERLDPIAADSTRLIAHPTAAAECPRAVAGPITLALGPEGGFIAEEIALFEQHGFLPVALGPRLLRVEQALPALLARLS